MRLSHYRAFAYLLLTSVLTSFSFSSFGFMPVWAEPASSSPATAALNTLATGASLKPSANGPAQPVKVSPTYLVSEAQNATSHAILLPAAPPVSLPKTELNPESQAELKPESKLVNNAERKPSQGVAPAASSYTLLLGGDLGIVGALEAHITKNIKNGEAALVVQGHEVFRFRPVGVAEPDFIVPETNARQALTGLVRFLKQAKQEAQAVTNVETAEATKSKPLTPPAYSQISLKSYPDKTELYAGSELLASLLSQDAVAAGEKTAFSLAQIWAKQLRQALGEPKTLPPRPSTLVNTPPQQWLSPPSTGGLTQQQALALALNKNLKAQGPCHTVMASWYGPGFHGRRCSDGSRFNMHGMTVAHRSLPFGTLLKVTNTRNGKTVLVKVTDRGPFVRGRALDLSKGAADAIGLSSQGVAKVTFQVVKPSAS